MLTETEPEGYRAQLAILICITPKSQLKICPSLSAFSTDIHQSVLTRWKELVNRKNHIAAVSQCSELQLSCLHNLSYRIT